MKKKASIGKVRRVIKDARGLITYAELAMMFGTTVPCMKQIVAHSGVKLVTKSKILRRGNMASVKYIRVAHKLKVRGLPVSYYTIARVLFGRRKLTEAHINRTRVFFRRNPKQKSNFTFVSNPRANLILVIRRAARDGAIQRIKRKTVFAEAIGYSRKVLHVLFKEHPELQKLFPNLFNQN